PIRTLTLRWPHCLTKNNCRKLPCQKIYWKKYADRLLDIFHSPMEANTITMRQACAPAGNWGLKWFTPTFITRCIVGRMYWKCQECWYATGISLNLRAN